MDNSFVNKLFEGSLKDYGSFAAGCYRDFAIVFSFENNMYKVVVNANSPYDAANEELKKEVGVLRQTQKKVNSSSFADETTVTLYLEKLIVLNKTLENINAVVNCLIDYLQTNGYKSGCKKCGSAENEMHLYYLNGNGEYYCDTCAALREEELAQNKDDQSEKNSNLMMGLVGALIGSLAGFALWMILDQVGFIAGIAGALMGLGAMKLYAKFGGCLDKKGVICCILVCVFMVFLANYTSFALAYYQGLKDYYYNITFGYCFRYVFELNEVNENIGTFIFQLIIGYVLTAVSATTSFKQAFAESTGNFVFKKLN